MNPTFDLSLGMKVLGTDKNAWNRFISTGKTILYMYLSDEIKCLKTVILHPVCIFDVVL